MTKCLLLTLFLLVFVSTSRAHLTSARSTFVLSLLLTNARLRPTRVVLTKSEKFPRLLLDKPLSIEYNIHMKTIDLTTIDTFTLSQEDVSHLSLSDRRAYALRCTARDMQRKYSCSYASGLSIAKDSLTAMKVVWS